MSRPAGVWGMRRLAASVGATMIMCGAVAVPVLVLPVSSIHAVAASLAQPASPGENNWG
jgi:hypothetical protein